MISDLFMTAAVLLHGHVLRSQWPVSRLLSLLKVAMALWRRTSSFRTLFQRRSRKEAYRSAYFASVIASPIKPFSFFFL